ncbi:hypothetical protein [Undibacterium fentianense]|uniref:Uncharacterized protein n=1 Tax=Undibacterium fentianense TaxID=2828728 RepID=A0A941E490_9BURK|nr:hypothetical protein [Undibacterium fentianense]MBR7799453.1 hypothetical protein [Undibacterium fentianense]
MTLLALWLPILLTAVGVFFASSLIHMVFKWHNSEYRPLPNDEDVRQALAPIKNEPGMYATPHCPDMKDMQTEAVQQKFRDGPVALITVRKPGAPTMGRYLLQWFALNLSVAALGGLLALQTMGLYANPHYAGHFIGLFTMIVYACGSIQESIWMGRPWSATFKNILDSLIYGVVSALVFWQFWPITN